MSTALISAAIGAVVAFVGSAGKSLIDARRAIDVSLRVKREPEYLKLWQLSGLFRLNPRHEVKITELRTLQDDLARWYFAGGGMYFSRVSHTAYRELHDSIRNTLHLEEQVALAGEVSGSDRFLARGSWSELRDRCSTLRTALTDDLLTRRSSRRLL